VNHETVHGFLGIDFSGFEQIGRKRTMVQGIRKKLGFEAEAIVFFKPLFL
jgi:hypothetical protein